MTPIRVTAASVALMLALVVSGCAGEQPTSNDAGHQHDPDTGHDMAAMAQIAEPPDSATWNAADAEYFTMMVAHHSQALDLAELADTRAVDPRVRAVADTIDAGQGREILVMAAWLVEHDQPEPTVESVAAMSSMGMPGMLSTTQLADLGASDGSAFDRRFLEDMIQHHQGAVSMAEDLLGAGEDVRVVAMATDVVAGQNAEIARMRDLLEQLP